jgi:hypothetical protein
MTTPSKSNVDCVLESIPSNPSSEYLQDKCFEVRTSMVNCLSAFVPEVDEIHSELRICINVATNLDESLNRYLVYFVVNKSFNSAHVQDKINSMDSNVKDLVILATDYSSEIKNRKVQFSLFFSVFVLMNRISTPGSIVTFMELQSIRELLSIYLSTLTSTHC